MPINGRGTSRFMGLLWLIAIIGLLSVSRSDFYLLWGIFTIAFTLYGFLVFSKSAIDFRLGLILALLIRILSFGFSPQLTDDYFRYIWDGMVMSQGINPMAYLPSYLLQHPEIAIADPTLFSNLNSPDYYSVYPPVAQLIFYISYAINHLSIGGHIFFYKAILLLADAAVIYLLYLLLEKNNLPRQRVLIYALNPLIIIEYTGNLHLEGLMIAFLLAAILFTDKRSFLLSSFLMTISIGIKLIPLIQMPFVPREMYWKKIIGWSLTTLGMTLIIFWVLFQNHTGWFQSVGLWFQTFEFNAGIYYVIRELDTLWRGYNNIQFIGPLLAGLTSLLIIIIWIFYLKKKKWHWSTAMLFVLTIYFLMTTTLHPWYLGTLLALSVISGHYYPVIWTYLVFLSYSHYSDGGFSEKYIYICIEYCLLFIWMFFEFRLVRLSPLPPTP